MSKRIPLTQGKFAIVDDADFEWLNQYKWCAHKVGKSWYAVGWLYYQNRKRQVGIHQLILNTPADMQSDHRNGDGLDNRRSNLRICTSSQNLGNSRKSKRRTSQFKGVYWERARRKWHVEIKVLGKRRHLGRFDDELEAAATYDTAARELFGEFARPNLEKADASADH